MQSNSLHCKLAVWESFQIKSPFCWKHAQCLQAKSFDLNSSWHFASGARDCKVLALFPSEPPHVIGKET